MGRADWHTFQILTKRHERLAHFASELTWHSKVWMGVSIETAASFSGRDYLRLVPATVRFVSAEPLLGPLEGLELDGIDWLIAGGESGPRHRPVREEWLRDLRDRCHAAGVKFLFKYRRNSSGSLEHLIQ